MHFDLQCSSTDTAETISLLFPNLPSISTKDINHLEISGGLEVITKKLDMVRLLDKQMRYLLQEGSHRVYINKKYEKKETIHARKCIAL